MVFNYLITLFKLQFYNLKKGFLIYNQQKKNCHIYVLYILLRTITSLKYERSWTSTNVLFSMNVLDLHYDFIYIRSCSFTFVHAHLNSRMIFFLSLFIWIQFLSYKTSTHPEIIIFYLHFVALASLILNQQSEIFWEQLNFQSIYFFLNKVVQQTEYGSDFYQNFYLSYI